MVHPIEKRAEQRLLAQHSQQTALRIARRERIQAGKADAFDCTSEEDVVCPHCGGWFDGTLELGDCIRRWETQDPSRVWHEVPCQNYEELFNLRVEVRYSFTTLKKES